MVVIEAQQYRVLPVSINTDGGADAPFRGATVHRIERGASGTRGATRHVPVPAGMPGTRRFDAATGGGDPTMADEITKTEAEWRASLTDEQYRVCREKGTERAFTGAYWDTKTPGVYRCVACGEPLFDAEAKFDSGTGWPSFWQPLGDAAVATETDTTLGMTRTEVHCRRCGSHLGHVFPDGPRPTGLRYCINSVSLTLDADEPG